MRACFGSRLLSSCHCVLSGLSEDLAVMESQQVPGGHFPCAPTILPTDFSAPHYLLDIPSYLFLGLQLMSARVVSLSIISRVPGLTRGDSGHLRSPGTIVPVPSRRTR